MSRISDPTNELRAHLANLPQDQFVAILWNLANDIPAVQQAAPDPIDHHPDPGREEAHQLTLWPDSHDLAPSPTAPGRRAGAQARSSRSLACS